MATISSDAEMRDRLKGLDQTTQRVLGARFAHAVREFTQSKELLRAIETGMEADAPQADLEGAYQTARALSVATYTPCGSDADWHAQAEHFVASACAAALAPCAEGEGSPAWRAAMQARIARTCAMIDNADGEVYDESGVQYAIIDELLG